MKFLKKSVIPCFNAANTWRKLANLDAKIVKKQATNPKNYEDTVERLRKGYKIKNEKLEMLNKLSIK